MIDGIFDLPDLLMALDFYSVLIRLLLALILGGIIGFERGRKHRPAGFRTYMIVSLASALIMMTNEYLFEVHGAGDPARLGAQVVSGIGFLGAGSIMISNLRIKGITTAAGLWAAAGLGLAVGAGFYVGALITGVFLLIVTGLMSRMGVHMYTHSKSMTLSAEFKSMEHFSSFMEEVHKMNYMISDIEIKSSFLGTEYIGVTFGITLPKPYDHEEIIKQLTSINGVKYIEEL